MRFKQLKKKNHNLKMPTFKQDWFTSNQDNLFEILNKYLDPDNEMHYLEIGSFEGRSLLWFMQHILKNEVSSATCIEPGIWGSSFSRFLNNISELGSEANKINIIKNFSYVALKSLSTSKLFDVVLIDGDHHAQSVLEDGILSFRLLKIGGIMIFDDYLWENSNYPDNKEEFQINPRYAIDTFMSIYKPCISILHIGYQVVIRKIENNHNQASYFHNLDPEMFE